MWDGAVVVAVTVCAVATDSEDVIPDAVRGQICERVVARENMKKSIIEADDEAFFIERELNQDPIIMDIRRQEAEIKVRVT